MSSIDPAIHSPQAPPTVDYPTVPTHSVSPRSPQPMPNQSAVLIHPTHPIQGTQPSIQSIHSISIEHAHRQLIPHQLYCYQRFLNR